MVNRYKNVQCSIIVKRLRESGVNREMKTMMIVVASPAMRGRTCFEVVEYVKEGNEGYEEE